MVDLAVALQEVRKVLPMAEQETQVAIHHPKVIMVETMVILVLQAAVAVHLRLVVMLEQAAVQLVAQVAQEQPIQLQDLQ